MIESFGDKLAEDLHFDRKSKEIRAFPQELYRAARRKVLYLHDAGELSDLRVPPGNRLEALKGEWKGYYSIRVNDQWRVVFKWQGNSARDVRIVDLADALGTSSRLWMNLQATYDLDKAAGKRHAA